MTEFLKGYAAGANDMEAGRLVTRVPMDVPAWSRPRIIEDREIPAGPALTAEEAEYVLGMLYEPHPDLPGLGNQVHAKLSLIANGENQ